MIDLRFNGMRWAAHPLQDGAANPVVAHNLWRRNALLEPLRAGAKAQDLPSADFRFARGFFLHDEAFVATERRIDMATTQVARDRARRLYFVDNGLLQFLGGAQIPATYPTPIINGHRVGVPVPTPQAPDPFGNVHGTSVLSLIRPEADRDSQADGTIVAFEALPEGEKDLYRDTAVTYTYVNRYGEEGAPALPSRTVLVRSDATDVLVNGLRYSDDPDVVGLRVYVQIDGEYFRLAAPEIEHPGTETTATVPNLTLANEYDPGTARGNTTTLRFRYSAEAVGDLLVTDDWAPPPEGVSHLASLENGMLAIADAHNVYLSEPYQWHAFPTANTWPVEGRIKRLARIDGGLVVLTDRDVRFVLGSRPETMQEVSRRYPHAIGDPASLIDLDGGIGYVTDEGIATIYAGGGQIATDGWIDRYEWSERVSVDECRMALHDGRLLLATRHPGTDAPTGYVLNLAAQEITSFDISEEALASGFFRDPRDGRVAYVVDASGLGDFNRGEPLLATWESGDIVVPGAIALGALRVEADGYPVEVTVKPERQPHVLTSVAGNRPRRVRAGHRARRLRLEVRTRTPVAAVRLAPDLRSA